MLNSEKRYGILLEDITSNTISNFKNIDIYIAKQVSHSETGKILNNCLIISPNEKIDKETFSKIFEEFLIENKNDFISSIDIKKMLMRLSDITKRQYDDLRKVVGVWGELHLIDSLIKVDLSEASKSYLINSWESEGKKSLHDFTFTSSQRIIEVKTTLLSERSHHIFDYEQVVTNDNSYEGFLLSICIKKDKEGLSNKDIVSSIKSKLSSQLKVELDKKLEIKGDLAYNEDKRFVLNKEVKKAFFPFEIIPRPGIVPGISNVSWRTLLEESNSLPEEKSASLLDDIIGSN